MLEVSNRLTLEEEVIGVVVLVVVVTGEEGCDDFCCDAALNVKSRCA